MIGNLKRAIVIHDVEDLHRLDGESRIGIVSQTTNRPEKVQKLVEAIRNHPGVREVRFCDTICQPVKDRQRAIGTLLEQDIDLGVVIGGYTSANTRKLAELIIDKGIEAHHIERAEELDPAWFAGKTHIGITAGTSTPQDVIEAVQRRVREIVGLV